MAPSCGLKMEKAASEVGSCKTSRPVRNRRYSRKVVVAGPRSAKRLFTPEIKRYLKDWLVRRRENPYPNRDEKKLLAVETGLSYIQICNWFANWRRKLKNVAVEKRRKTWGHLIKTYNDHAQGNVEQFSICSEDSIWEEADRPKSSLSGELCEEHDKSLPYPHQAEIEQCYKVSSTTEDSKCNQVSASHARYSTKINSEVQTCILTQPCDEASVPQDCKLEISGPLLLSKWLESAARFQPSENNYGWWSGRPRARCETVYGAGTRHGQDEVEAALALTVLAGTALSQH